MDHPRTCGEHPIRLRPAQARPGSSPHMRGTLSSVISTLCYHGIIPAHAGNTQSSVSGTPCTGDHPRTCGEHDRRLRRCDRNPGSSPHMRGTQCSRLQKPSQGGIIPAHAGNTQVAQLVRPFPRDHPRTCGEHFRDLQTAWGGLGSSPHMRGTRSTAHRTRCRTGIIPAHAGNTAGRGANRKPNRGSSPHMRGTP